ncbi:MAG: PEP-CTERM sorting domain-containing protein [Fimbriimonadaceae bacterium]|jgi:hypothetical protein|nr:PEP-CTERM sorting domain-containing protein [Fimbriimonadaceae bacterium]
MNLKSIVVFAALTLSCFALADTVSVDFESYPDGPITNGYDGWQITNPSWDQQVVSTSPITGNKSWRTSQRVASGSFGDQPYSPALMDKVSETGAFRRFDASWKWSPLVGGKNGEGVTVSIDNGTGQRGNWIRLENNGGLDTSWRIYLFDFNGISNTFPSVTLMENISAGTVLDMKFDMTFNPGANNDVWNMYINNTLMYTGVGWEDYFRNFAPTYGPTPVTYDRLLFRQSPTAIANAAGVLIDDIQYTSSVPEPATLTILALAGLLKRRRAAKKQAS